MATRQARNFTKRYQEMVYDADINTINDSVRVLARGKYHNFPFVILNVRGSHPTAYFGIGKEHTFYGSDYGDVPLDVHGGLTYSDNHVPKSSIKDKWWLGWDYAHVGDRMGYYPNVTRDKAWTREEILAEVKQAISDFEKL